MPCEIADGWKFTIELFFNPDTVRRFGVGTFGSDNFGDYTNSLPSVDRWVDLTEVAFDVRFTRGLTQPDITQSTDVLEFSLRESDSAPIVQWLPPESLSSPSINTPVRLTLTDPDANASTILTCRINSISELHGEAFRSLQFLAYGNKTEFRTLLLPQIFPAQSVAARIDSVLAQINYTDPVDPYPAEFATTDLLRDPEIRNSENELDAYQVMQQSTFSAGYAIVTRADGAIGWSNLRNIVPIPDPVWTITDCWGAAPGPLVELTNAAGEGNELVNALGQVLIDGGATYPLSTRQAWVSDTEQVLNVVQVLSVDPTISTEAVDIPSVERWGRRNSGFGFPISIASKDKADAQIIADFLLETTAYRINRVNFVEFHTLTDPRWFYILQGVEINQTWSIQRTSPTVQEIAVGIIGYTVNLTGTHIEGVIHTSVRTNTL